MAEDNNEYVKISLKRYDDFRKLERETPVQNEDEAAKAFGTFALFAARELGVDGHTLLNKFNNQNVEHEIRIVDRKLQIIRK